MFTLANAQRIDVVPFFNDLRRVFQIDYTAAGGLLSAYLLGYVLAQIPAGLAADNLPTRRVTVAGLAAITVASGLFAVTGSYWLATLLRGLMGVSAAALYSSTVKLTLGAATKRGAAMGVLQSGAGTGMIIGLFAMPLLGQATSLRAAFLGMAAFSCLACMAAALFLPRGAPRPPGAGPLGAQVGRIVGQRHFAYLSSCVFLRCSADTGSPRGCRPTFRTSSASRAPPPARWPRSSTWLSSLPRRLPGRSRTGSAPAPRSWWPGLACWWVRSRCSWRSAAPCGWRSAPRSAAWAWR